MVHVRLFLVFLVLSLTGCDRPSNTTMVPPRAQDTQQQAMKNSLPPAAQSSYQFSPFHVYVDKGSRENHFIPSGFMPNGKCLSLNDRWINDCQSGNTCIQIAYDVNCSMNEENWSGIYWLNPANNWGNRKGGFDLAGAQKVTFWAKGAKGGERIEEFKIGGISGDYPDSDTAMIGPVILTNEWKQYAIDLRGKDLSYISGGFAWATNADVNPGECTFYLDNIQYE